MITEEQNRDIEFCKKILIDEIVKIVSLSDKLKEKLTSEVLMSVVYLKIFSAYTQEKKIETLEESFNFMNSIKGVIEKIFYVNQYLQRLTESLKIASEKK